MSDVRRGELNSLPSSENGVFQKSKNKKNKKQTIRISLVLSEPTEDSCCEFNYRDELRNKIKKLHGNNDNPPENNERKSSALLDDDDDDADVRRIAQQMEEKYGGTFVNKKKRKRDDYVDIGMGYDESDSFIDNTDGYDEIIPQNINTIHGGFYINCGALEFKADADATSDSSSSSSEEAPTKIKRKRILDVASDDSDDVEVKPTPTDTESIPKRVKIQTCTSPLTAMKKKLFGNKMQVKKKSNFQKKTFKEILREKRRELNMSDVHETSENQEGEVEQNKMASSIAETIESVVKAVSSTPKASSVGSISFKTPKPEEEAKSIAGHSDEQGPGISAPILPHNLPNEVLEDINKIRSTVESNQYKTAVFTEELDQLLLNLERQSRCVGKSSKLKIYEYLSALLNCKKAVLIAHCSKIILKSEDDRLKQLVKRLKAEIDRVMPKLLRVYEEESQQFALQKKLSNEDNKMRGPKRRFHWSEISRKTLQEIMKIRKKCFILEDKPRESLECLMTAYLKSNIQVLWPEGWMSMTYLMKMYNGGIGNREAKLPVKNTKPANSSNQHMNITNKNNISNSAESFPKPSFGLLPSKESSKTNIISNPVREDFRHNSQSAVELSKNNVNQAPKETKNSITQSVKDHQKPSYVSDPEKPVLYSNNLRIVESLPCSSSALNLTSRSMEDSVRTDSCNKVKKPSDTAVTADSKEGSTLLAKVDQFSENSRKAKEHERHKDHRKVNDSQKHVHLGPSQSSSRSETTEVVPEQRPKSDSKTDINNINVMKLKNFEGSDSRTRYHLRYRQSSRRNETPETVSEQRSRSNSKTDVSNLDMMQLKNYEGNEIHKLMEDLKILHKLSSPMKSSEASSSQPNSQTSSGSQVSVITSNKSAPPKVSTNHNDIPHRDNTIDKIHEEFQRQFMESIGHDSVSSKSLYNCN